MKRRNFVKGLAALAIAPVAAIANTSTPSPAKVEPYCRLLDAKRVSVPLYTIKGDGTDYVERLRLAKEAMRNMGEASKEAAEKTGRLRESLENIYMSPEAWDDIRTWDADPVDNLREEIQYDGFQIPDYYNDHVAVYDYKVSVDLGREEILEFRDGLHPDFQQGGKFDCLNQNERK